MIPSAARSVGRGALLVALAATGWGTWPLFLRQAEKGGPIPATLEAAAAMIGMLIASFFTIFRDRVHVRASLGDWSKIALLGVTDALNVMLLFLAYQRTSVAIAVLTHYFAPMLITLFAPILKLEPWQRRTFITVGIALVGLVLLLSPWSAERHAGDFLGGALGLASAACYATNVLGSKSLVSVFSGSEMTFYHVAISVLLLVSFVPLDAWSHVGHPGVVWLALGALLPGASCTLLFVWGLRRVHASEAASLTLLEPLVATVGASVVMHQPLGVPGFVGGALILTGAAFAAAGRVA